MLNSFPKEFSYSQIWIWSWMNPLTYHTILFTPIQWSPWFYLWCLSPRLTLVIWFINGERGILEKTFRKSPKKKKKSGVIIKDSYNCFPISYFLYPRSKKYLREVKRNVIFGRAGSRILAWITCSCPYRMLPHQDRRTDRKQALLPIQCISILIFHKIYRFFSFSLLYTI